MDTKGMSHHPKLVVIESPYSGDIQANIEYLLECVHDSYMIRGEAPIASHLIYTRLPKSEMKIEDDVYQGHVVDNGQAYRHGRDHGIACGFAWNKHADVVAVYIDRGISDGMARGIHFALDNGIEVVFRSIRFSMETLKSLTYTDPTCGIWMLCKAIVHDNDDIVRFLMDISSIKEMVVDGYVKETYTMANIVRKFVIDNNADIGYVESTKIDSIIQLGMYYKSLKSLQALFEFGVFDYDAFNFAIAMWGKNSEMVGFLKRHGFVVDMERLSYGVGNEDTDELKNLLDAGIDPNSRPWGGPTRLMLACERDDYMSVRCLIDYGADTTLKNYRGEDALSYATRCSSHRSVTIIKAHQNWNKVIAFIRIRKFIKDVLLRRFQN